MFGRKATSCCTKTSKTIPQKLRAAITADKAGSVATWLVLRANISIYRPYNPIHPKLCGPYRSSVLPVGKEAACEGRIGPIGPDAAVAAGGKDAGRPFSSVRALHPNKLNPKTAKQKRNTFLWPGKRLGAVETGGKDAGRLEDGKAAGGSGLRRSAFGF